MSFPLPMLVITFSVLVGHQPASQSQESCLTRVQVLVFVNSLMLLLTVPFAFGQDPMTVTLQDVIDSNKFAVLSQPIWAWAMALIKISVAAMLMRVEPDRRWQQFLWAMIGLQIVVGTYNTFSVTLQCIPLHGAWDFLNQVTDKKCWSQDAIRINSITVSSFHIVTDVIFALMPINFLRKVQRPLRERIIIGVLMALGVFASIASIMKAVAAARLGKTDDPNAEGITVGTWSAIEEQIAFITACIPCLRSPFQALLQRFGLVSVVNTTTNKPTGASHGYGRMYGNDTDKEDGATGIRMKSVMRDAQSEESILPPGGEHEVVAKGEIWRTTEVHLEEGAPASIHGGDDAWVVEKGRKPGIV